MSAMGYYRQPGSGGQLQQATLEQLRFSQQMNQRNHPSPGSINYFNPFANPCLHTEEELKKPPPEDKPKKVWLGGLSAKQENKEQSVMSIVKEYFNKHRELFMGLAVALLLDRYVFGGAFQERLKRIITGVLDKAEDSLGVKKS